MKDACNKKNLYCVSKLNTQHNHSITNAAFYCHNKNRKLPIELQKKAKDSLNNQIFFILYKILLKHSYT